MRTPMSYKQLRRSYPEETNFVAKVLRGIYDSSDGILEYFKTHAKRKAFNGYRYVFQSPTRGDSFVALWIPSKSEKFRRPLFVASIWDSDVIRHEGELDNRYKEEINKRIENFLYKTNEKESDEKISRWVKKAEALEKYIKDFLKSNNLSEPKNMGETFSKLRELLNLTHEESAGKDPYGDWYEDFEMIEGKEYPRVGLRYDWDKDGPQIYLQRKCKDAYGPWVYLLDGQKMNEFLSLMKKDTKDALNGRNLFKEEILRLSGDKK